MHEKRILFVIGNAASSIGGHILSTLTLAKYLRKRGYEVGLLLAPLPDSIPELAECEFTLHFVPLLPGRGAIFTQPFNIYKIVKEFRYDVLVAMDWYASLYSILALARYKLPLVQVIAGGEGPPSDPLELPGIIVFSEELMNSLPKKYNIPRDRLILSPGRIDFEAYKMASKVTEPVVSLSFTDSSPKVLAVSRLGFNKAKAISALLAQVEQFAQQRAIQCVVVGDGDSKQKLEEDAKRIISATENRANIRFVGGYRVGPNDLKQADLVVGQGRTILEAIASGIPAAVCGNNGYFGLITPQTFLDYASTNFTGRQLTQFSTLDQDINQLDSYIENDKHKVYDLAFKYYDASLGAGSVEKAIIMLCEYYRNSNITRLELGLMGVKAYLISIKNLIKRRIGM